MRLVKAIELKPIEIANKTAQNSFDCVRVQQKRKINIPCNELEHLQLSYFAKILSSNVHKHKHISSLLFTLSTEQCMYAHCVCVCVHMVYQHGHLHHSSRERENGEWGEERLDNLFVTISMSIMEWQ